MVLFSKDKAVPLLLRQIWTRQGKFCRAETGFKKHAARLVVSQATTRYGTSLDDHSSNGPLNCIEMYSTALRCSISN